MKLTWYWSQIRPQSWSQRWHMTGLLAALAVVLLAVGCAPNAAELGTVEEVAPQAEAAATEAPVEEATSEEAASNEEAEEVAVEEPAEAEAEPEETAAADEESAPDLAAADAEVAAAEAADVDWSTVFNRTDDDRFVIGNPDAPVTLIEYSDFM